MPLRHACRAPLIALLLLGSGCTPLIWHKTGAGADAVEADQARCLAQARTEARQRIPFQTMPVPHMVVDRQGRRIPVQQPSQPDPERFFLEQNLLRRCMTDLGYTLESAPPQDR